MLKKFLAITACIMCITALSGCATSKFESVRPPIKEFNEEFELVEQEVIRGDWVETKSFSGNKIGHTLFLRSSGSSVEFAVGETGTVTFSTVDSLFNTFSGEVIQCPEKGETGDIVVQINGDDDLLDFIGDYLPGTFGIETKRITDCVMIPKECVLLLDGDGNAFCYQTDEKGILVEREIIVGERNSEYYQVISGIEPGETVVECR